jgi:aspartyl-tRNA(Asn)/glutamyl-tRNA(Gln) amidotransferase subunit A
LAENEFKAIGMIPMPDDDLFFSSLTHLGQLLRARKLSSVELTKIFLERLGEIGQKYNALAELTPDLAMEQARRADRRLRRGDLSSPLLGIPYGAKDLLATKGIPTRWGAPPYRHQVFDYDATVIRRLQDAGAVLIGKLAMVELAGGGGYAYASASLHGPGLNPWNVEHWSGGSSSGSGSAVAAALVPFALGSETWGSIITPSTYCGVTGLRPTWGRVSRAGAMELSWSMDKIGPMAKSAVDCGLVLEAIAGYDPNDWTTLPLDFRFGQRTARRGFKLGVLPADFSGAPEIGKAFEDAVRVLRKLGMKTTHVKLPDYAYAEIARILLAGESGAAHEKFIRGEKLTKLVDSAQKKGLRKSIKLSAGEYVRAQKMRAQLTLEVLELFERFDALVSPSLVIEASALDTNLQAAFVKRGGYSVLGALCGLPTITVPMGFGSQGLPLGLSLTGYLFDEQTLLQIAMIYQSETRWHRMRPPTIPDEIE